ncbi:MAG TPA: 1-deoxy-D-xylulose-5-phosphate synthase [Planctomycetota bacterium]|nr:1-deoxy-D-xylulose-5-phosphate synthase [Planctomycetota bacterium]
MTEAANPPTGTKPARLLDGVHSPQDLKRLPLADLPQLCAEMRAFLMETVPVTGGHLGSNLGVVELSVALHTVFDLRRDRCVWDVSHQAYPHKLLTGRRERFGTLRQTGGLCGFTHPEESEYDLFHTGHAGTSISLALGLAHGLGDGKDAPHAIAVIGDASLGAGVAFEGLNNAGASKKRLLVILNDNEWSISKSVGSLAKYLSRIRSARVVQRAGQEIHGLLSAIPVIGPRVDRALDDLGEVMRHAVVPGHIFEELGVTYVGPVNGHNVQDLVEQMQRVKDLEGCVLLHLLTEKGKGHPNAPTHPERVHGVKPGSAPRTAGAESSKLPAREQAAVKKPQGPAYTSAFADSLLELAKHDVRIHAITAGMPSGTGLETFAERLPARFHDTGITEQHAVAFCAGMAKAGLRPVATIYSTFLQRAYDQVFQEVALQNLPVLFCMDRAGLVGQDGPTHNGVFDLAYLRTLPNFVLASPRDATDMRRMLEMGLRHGGPVALRYPRANTTGNERIHASERRDMLPGRAEVLCEGDASGVVVWALGAMVDQALEAAERLAAAGIHIGVVDARFAKPLDVELLTQHAVQRRALITVEEHQRAGGFGSAVLESVSRLPHVRATVKVLAIPDRFLEHKTTREEQLDDAGLDAAAIERAVRSALNSALPVE